MSEVDDLRATVESLAARVRALEDKVEIMQLVAQYGPAADSGDGAATAALWTEDGTFDVAGHFRLQGREAIAGMLNDKAGHQALIASGAAHVLTVPHVVVDGDEASGRSHALNIRWDAAADRFQVGRVSANTWQWARTSQGWRIAERVNANLDGSAAHRQMLAPPAATTGRGQ
jgi:uncharacterized protein (TIGR02246 family)